MLLQMRPPFRNREVFPPDPRSRCQRGSDLLLLLLRGRIYCRHVGCKLLYFVPRIDAKRAASWASLFYVGITIGRFFCGFITMKLNDQKMIRLGQAVIAVGTILMLLPLGDSLLFIGLILIGLGCAPIYPSIIHETPANFGADLSQGIIGIQMAFAYVGTCLMPPVFGVLGQHISFGLYPVFLMAILILMVVMAERMHRVTAEKRNSYKANY